MQSACLLSDMEAFKVKLTVHLCHGLFTLAETDSDTDSDSNSKPNGQWLYCTVQIFSRCMESDSDSNPDCKTTRMGSESGSGSEAMSSNVIKPSDRRY